MSIDAGCTHFGSNGSIPMRPASIAARMSRSERTTTTEYAGLRPAHRDIRGAVADHDGFLGRDAQTAHRVLGQIGRRLGPRSRIAAEVHVDVLVDFEPAEDALAIDG